MIEAELLSEKRCPVCRKSFTVLWPHQWAYKRGISHTVYFCSWKCLRADEKKGDKNMGAPRIVSEEQEKEAVRIALEGGDPLKYLEECGSNIPPQKWYQIKQKIKDTDPETYAKLPKRIPRKDAVKKPVETPEGEYIVEQKAPAEPEGIEVSAIRHKNFGEFYRDLDHNCIDWRTPCDDEMSMSIQGWKDLYIMLPAFFARLGVKL